VTARPHPRAALRPDGIEEEDAADDDAILEHVEVILVPADRRAFEDELLGEGRSVALGRVLINAQMSGFGG